MPDTPPIRRLIVLDVDSTLIRDEVIELLAAHAGVAEQVRAVTESAMRGELDFAESLRRRVATLAGLPVDVFDAVRDAVRLTPGAAELVAECRRRDWPVGLVSGGFHEIVDPLAAGLGMDTGMVRANRLQVREGRLTGRTEGPVIDRAAKAAALRGFAADHGIPMRDTVAVGDGANDIDMVQAAGLGVAFEAKPALRAVADRQLSGRLDDLIPLLLDASHGTPARTP